MSEYVIPMEFKAAIDFTETYCQYENEHIAIREAMCLRAQYPAILTDIREGDLFAGRVAYGPIGFRPYGGGLSYYCNEGTIRNELKKDNIPGDYRRKLEEAVNYWKDKTTEYRALSKETHYAPEIENALLAADRDWTREIFVAGCAYRFAGIHLDFVKLMRLGIPGMLNEVERHTERARQENGDVKLYEAMRMCLELLVHVCRFYASMAKEKAEVTEDGKRKRELTEMADVLERITARKPETFREAIQLFWLYALLSHTENFGRMDIYLGDFYVRDVDTGKITEEQAMSMLQSVWRLIAATIDTSFGRIIVGGIGRPNEENADRFALLAMEASRTVKAVLPQLTLRFYKGMNPQLFSKALDVIGEGCTYPVLYNDDVNVPAVVNSFGIIRKEAEQYVPSDCGEFRIDHRSVGSPNASMCFYKALEVTLFNGIDPVTGKPMGLKTGEFTGLKAFDELWNAYKTQTGFFIKIISDRLLTIYQAMEESAAYLFASMLTDDCIEKGKGLFGGVRYKGGIVETHSLINTADCLTAIKQLVYEKKVLTPEKLLEILKANFKGYEKERRLMLDAPKYGNDDAVADSMALNVYNYACSTVKAQCKRLSLDYCLADLITASGHVYFGRHAGASVDGRLAGAPLANANNPTHGYDRSGVTAMLNSMAKLNPSNIGGQVQNLKFNRDMFTKYREKLEALLAAYFSNGAPQVMITVVNRGDLENAMKEPEKYANLVVRVGGFSAQFVTLERDLQEEILARTLN